MKGARSKQCGSSWVKASGSAVHIRPRVKLYTHLRDKNVHERITSNCETV